MNEISEFSKSGRPEFSRVILGNSIREFGMVGGEGRKAIVSVDVVGSEGRMRNVGNFLIKEISSSKLNPTGAGLEGLAEKIEERYFLLKAEFLASKKKGAIGYVPLPPTLRRQDNKILMTDMRNNGSNLVIDFNSFKENEGVRVKNREEIDGELEAASEAALRAGIILGIDAYAIVVSKKSKEGQLYLLDIGLNTFKIDEYKGEKTPEKAAADQIEGFKVLMGFYLKR